jgi:hypothetical protein
MNDTILKPGGIMKDLTAVPLRAPKRGGRSVTILVARDLLNAFIEEDPNIAHQLVEDISKRDEFGYKKYGQNLETHDGRPTIWDLYQELLDGVQYARKQLEEGRMPEEMACVYPTLIELVRITRTAINNWEGFEDALDWKKPEAPDAGDACLVTDDAEVDSVTLLP